MANIPIDLILNDEFMTTIWSFYETSLTPRTRREYFGVLKDYVKTTNNNPLYLTKESTDLYYKYIESRLKENRLSYTTALMRISVMRSVCEYIRYHQNSRGLNYSNYFADIILTDVDKTIKNDRLPSESELDAILLMANEADDDKAFIIFSLVVKCGLTSSEICSLNLEYIETDPEEFLYIHFPAKNRTARTIKLPHDVGKLLNQYIEKHEIFNGAIFINKRKNRLKIRDAERLLNKYIERGIEEKKIEKRFTLQMMRHAAFKYMLKGGASEDQVARYGGITTKWMSRYRQVAASEITSEAVDYSIINISEK